MTNSRASVLGNHSPRIEDLSIFSKVGEEMIAFLKDLNHHIERDYGIACKEKVITDFYLSKELIIKKIY